MRRELVDGQIVKTLREQPTHLNASLQQMAATTALVAPIAGIMFLTTPCTCKQNEIKMQNMIDFSAN